ncbi:polyprenyl synthetase family protein [Clostridium sp. C2-6-12]|uniref:polyprenyl synthetase family protein n=1 Tax=Clostridium sp. C2-6-12 TaxID=2698832 RepID=UPI00136B5FB4|nr:polyprenyl synthetase family protein [Clostridium sp. C2-6-12]
MLLEKINYLDYFEDDLIKIREIIELNLDNKDKNTVNLLNNLAATEGKMIRAIFILIGGAFGNIERKSLLNLSSGIELLHLATLVHDDIIDDSNLRRGKRTINNLYGAKAALFMGDYLFAQSYIIFSEYASKKSISDISKTIKFICESEINQFLSTYSLNSNIRDYFRRINGKCASLFSLSLSLGAYDGQADSEVVNKLKKIGYYIGMTFQLIDDILDIVSPKVVLGKPSNNDIAEGIYTFPVLYEIKNNNQALLYALKENDCVSVFEILKNSDGLKKAKNIAGRYTTKALTLIDKLPDVSEKYILKEIAESLLKRTF